MTDATAAMRAWLDAHGLADAELLHHLANQDSDGKELTDSDRQLLSALLETRRAVVPGYRPTPIDRPTTQDQPGSATPPGLFDPGPTPQPEWAAVESTDRHARPSVRPAARHRTSLPPAQRLSQRDWEERER